MGGKKYSNGFILDNSNWTKGTIYFNLDAKYKNITLNLGPVDGTGLYNSDTDVSFFVDDKLVAEHTFKKGDLPKKVTISVNYGLKLYVEHNDRDGALGFGDIVVE